VDTILDNILTIMIFMPLVVGGFIMLTPLSHKLGQRLAFLSSIIVMLLGILLFINFESSGVLEFTQKIPLIESYGIYYSVGVDGIALMILLIIAFSFPLLHLVLNSQNKGYWANMLLMQSAFMAVLLAKDLIFFYASWEAMLLPIFTMIGLYGKDDDKAKASMKLMLYTIAGSLFMLFAIISLGSLSLEQFGYYSFDLDELKNLDMSDSQSFWLFACFMLAFSVKIPLFPLHMWMPDSYAKAPVGVTFALSAIASKVAIYAILRFVLPIFPEQFVNYADVFVFLGIFGMLYFALVAIAQTDIKRTLAYSSASHLGLITAGIFGLNMQSMVGGIYQLIAHAMSTGILFLLVGKIGRELKTRDINSLGGIASKAPVFATFFAIATFSTVGLPGTNGFIGEFLIILGTFKFNAISGIFASLSVIVGAIYMFILYRKVIFQKTNAVTEKFTDLSKKQIVAFLPLIILIFVMGIYPKPFLEKIEPTIAKKYNEFILPNTKEKR